MPHPPPAPFLHNATAAPFDVPARLHGRGREQAALQAAFARVAGEARSECVLVSGPAGAGKSSLVRELQFGLPGEACLFAVGKSDQFQHDQPYATLAQALQGLAAMALAQPPAALASCQAALRAAVDSGGAQMLSLVPQLEVLIGPQSAAAPLAAPDAQARFRQMLQRVLQVFATPQRPLLLFLDDLQWADAATLELLEHLLTEPALRHLLLLVAWREPARGPAQALHGLPQRLQAAGTPVQTLVLQPLAPADTAAIVGEMLRTDAQACAALATQVHARSGGNPLFAKQWLTELAERGLLQPDGTGWRWDLAQTAAADEAASVPALVATRLQRLPAASQHALQQLACLGLEADLTALAAASALAPAVLAEALQPAVQAGLVQCQAGRCAFAHDRVREAAYAQLSAPARAASHLRIAHQLRAQRSPDEQLLQVFAITDQLNRGIDAMADADEREQAAELNLLAARRARLSAAYGAVQTHVDTGIALLAPGHWERCHTLSFELHRLQAECALLLGRLEQAEPGLAALLPHARSATEQAAVVRLQVVLHAVRSDYARAVQAAARGLAAFGLPLPPHPSQAELDAAHAQVLQLLDGRDSAALVALPRSTDRQAEAAMDVLAELFAPACFTDERLAQLHLCRMVALSLQHGLTEASAQGFAWYGILLGHHQGRYADAWRFVQAARAIVERHQLRALEAKSLFAQEIASGWSQPLDQAVRLARAAFTAGAEGGDVMVACFACHHLANDLLVRGAPLAQVLQEIDTGLAYVHKAGFLDVADELQTQRRFVRALMGHTRTPADWQGEDADAADFEAALHRPGRMPTMVFWYWLLRAQAHYFAGDAAAALAALERAEGWTWSSPVHIQFVHHVFFGALALAAHEDGVAAPEAARRTRIAALRARLAHWCAQCAANFEDKLTLVDAEIARLEQRPLEAARLYQLAADQARSHGFVQNEALAHELAARLHAALGLSTASEAHWRQAHAAYGRWGAAGKARQLEESLLFLQPVAAAAPAPQRPAPADMVRASQALSGEIRRERLYETLLRFAIEQTGADRALLLLLREGHWQVEARAQVDAQGLQLGIRRGAPQADEIPAGLLQHMARGHQRVLLDDALAAPALPFALAENGRPLRALLCQPLQGRDGLVGLLYLENSRVPGVFTPERLAQLELLAAQAVISLENARLVEDLQREIRERQDAEREGARVQAALAESELRFRRMADATPDVLWITELVPERVVYVSPSFERVWGCTPEALYRDPRLWTQGIHAEDREAVEHAFVDWIGSGAQQPWGFEFRVVRPDGTLRWVHDRGVMISDGATRRVTGTATDITERKEAEAALRNSESRFALAAAGSNDGIFDWDIPNDRMYLSERAQRLYGLEPGPQVRRREEWVGLLRQHADDAALRTERLWGYLEGRLPAYDGEYRILHADGLYRWVRIQGLCVRDAGGRPTRMAGSISDIDPHKRAEAALRQTQRLEAVGTLAGGIAHDFNNILGAILGFGEMALCGTRAGSRARRDIEFIMTAGERGRALVERILAFSRSGLSERVPVHIEGVTQETLQLMSASVPGDVRLALRLAAGRAASLGDATQWHQVVMNLVTNALQAMPDGGALRVELTLQQLVRPRAATTGTLSPGEYLVLEVADTGAGIAPEHLARIFDPFFTTREAGSGTGLGLSLVHGIVAEFGGAVDVRTEPSAGSCFSVLLPRAGDAATPAQADSAALPRGRHEQILVVDDEEALLHLAIQRLTELGYVPVGFRSGTEALAAFAAHPERFDAVLTDERMPGLSGTDLVREIHALRPGMPILLVTGYTDTAQVRRARDAGANVVLGKPLASKDLARALARALARVLAEAGRAS